MLPSEEHLAFHYSVGQAITAWASIEFGLARTAVISLKPRDQYSLLESFYTIENFRSKLAFADRAFGHGGFSEELQTEWVKIRDHVRSLSSLRNQIAHRFYLFSPDNTPTRRECLISYPAKLKLITDISPKPPSGALCVKDVHLAYCQFGQAAHRLMGLHDKMLGKEPFPTHGPQEPQPQTLAQLRRQILAMSSPRAKPSRG